MRLYYTGALEPFASQKNALLSLGGYISNTPVEQQSTGNIFSSIGQNDMINGSVETRMIALKNQTGANQTVTLYYENLPDSVVYYKMSLVAPALDDCQKPFFERIDTVNSSPVQASFTDNRSGSELTFAINNDEYIGIWIQRVVVASKGSLKLTCDYLNANFDATPLKTSIAWQLAAGNKNGHYFTVGDVLIGLTHDNTVTFPIGYEVIKVSYLLTDTDQQINQKIADRIDQILVDRGEATRENNTVFVDKIIQGPVSNGFQLTFNQGQLKNNLEKMSLFILW